MSVIWVRGPLVSCRGSECGRTGSFKVTESGRDDPKNKGGGRDNEDVLRTETGGDGLEPRFGAVGAKEAGGILDAAL